jgi:hypothetical protein
MSSVEKLESRQAFILPQQRMNNKCREVDLRAFRVQSPESRVQSPESRVQSPESRVQRNRVAEALSAKIARLETEDQQAVVTELRTHEQGLVSLFNCRRA